MNTHDLFDDIAGLDGFGKRFTPPQVRMNPIAPVEHVVLIGLVTDLRLGMECVRDLVVSSSPATVSS